MLCGGCGEREAQVFIKQIVNNKVAQLALCERCAASRGLSPASPNALFLAIMSSLGLGPQGPRAPALKCPSCGIHFSQFQETGRLGCAGCYGAFDGPLEELLGRIHGATRHRGKQAVPGGGRAAAEAPAAQETLAGLRRALKAAVEREDFEEAAALRDRIKALEGEEK